MRALLSVILCTMRLCKNLIHRRVLDQLVCWFDSSRQHYLQNIIMTRYELFKQLFHSLDSVYDEKKKELDELVGLLVNINPYLVTDGESADPAMYSDFCKIVTSEEINEADAKELTDKFLKSLSPWISKTTVDNLIQNYKLTNQYRSTKWYWL